MKGKVKWFDDTKGYGFIEGEDGKDAFVHHSSIVDGVRGKKTLAEKQRVEYDVETTPKGPKAQNVRKLV